MSREIKFNKILPHYKCHKVVGALKIKDVVRTGDRFSLAWKLIFEEPGYEPIIVNDSWVQTHHVTIGGYIVQYKDGYVSYSPADVFEDGYSKVNS